GAPRCHAAGLLARRHVLDRAVDDVERGPTGAHAPRPHARRAGSEPQPMTLCDLSSFYCEKGGGVSTCHRARLEWFSRQTRHRYVLISPGASTEVKQISATAWTATVPGPRTSRDPYRYRLLTNYSGVRAMVE